MNVTKETVTPKKAMEWLKRNVANRPLSPVAVGRYAKTMEQGLWKLNGDCIRFNGNGDLIDGQHRLTACIQSGKQFESYIVRGLQHDAFDTIDQGRRRSIGDVFARQGYKHYNTVAAAVRAIWRYENGWMQTREGMRPDEANDILERHPGVHDAAQRSCEARRPRLMSPGLLAFLMYQTRQSDESKSVKFWTDVIDGEGLSKTMPAYWLRERLMANTMSVTSLHQDVICALSIKAWNTFKSGRACKNLKWDSAREEFPVIE
jgi:hypothetical protein